MVASTPTKEDASSSSSSSADVGEPAAKRQRTQPGGTVLGDLTDKNLGQLRLLNSVIFPVRYGDKFYKSLLDAPDFTRLAFYNFDVLAGAVCCKEIVEDGVTKLYIMTLGVLSAYRNLGIGRTLLEYVLDTVCAKRKHIRSVYLHVQTSNETALAFYKKFGFKIEKTIENYYKRISPTDCYLLEKQLPQE